MCHERFLALPTLGDELGDETMFLNASDIFATTGHQRTEYSKRAAHPQS